MDVISSERRRFGEKLRELRKEAGLSQARFGELAGLSEPMIRKLEKGTTEPLAFALARMARVLAKRLPKSAARTLGARRKTRQVSADTVIAVLVAHVRSEEELVHGTFSRERRQPDSRLSKMANSDILAYDFDEKRRVLDLLGLLPRVRSRRGRPARAAT